VLKVRRPLSAPARKMRSAGRVARWHASEVLAAAAAPGLSATAGSLAEISAAAAPVAERSVADGAAVPEVTAAPGRASWRDRSGASGGTGGIRSQCPACRKMPAAAIWYRNNVRAWLNARQERGKVCAKSAVWPVQMHRAKGLCKRNGRKKHGVPYSVRRRQDISAVWRWRICGSEAGSPQQGWNRDRRR
jgi:hypothetical protein